MKLRGGGGGKFAGKGCMLDVREAVAPQWAKVPETQRGKPVRIIARKFAAINIRGGRKTWP